MIRAAAPPSRPLDLQERRLAAAHAAHDHRQGPRPEGERDAVQRRADAPEEAGVLDHEAVVVALGLVGACPALLFVGQQEEVVEAGDRDAGLQDDGEGGGEGGQGVTEGGEEGDGREDDPGVQGVPQEPGAQDGADGHEEGRGEEQARAEGLDARLLLQVGELPAAELVDPAMPAVPRGQGMGGCPPPPLPTALTLPERPSHTPTPAPTAFPTARNRPPPQPLAHPP